MNANLIFTLREDFEPKFMNMPVKQIEQLMFKNNRHLNEMLYCQEISDEYIEDEGLLVVEGYQWLLYIMTERTIQDLIDHRILPKACMENRKRTFYLMKMH